MSFSHITYDFRFYWIKIRLSASAFLDNRYVPPPRPPQVSLQLSFKLEFRSGRGTCQIKWKNVLFYGTIDISPRLVIPQFSRRLRRTFYTGRFVLTFPFRLITGPARSLVRSPALSGISISPFAPKGATSPRVLINCAALCAALYAGSHLRFLHHHRRRPFSSVFSSFYLVRARSCRDEYLPSGLPARHVGKRAARTRRHYRFRKATGWI